MAHGPRIEIRPADEGRWAGGKLPRAQHDQRPAERFLADLERETDASLRADPSRWPWRTSSTIADRHRGRLPQGRRW
jgi:hypothetical protein